jgi:hypothetical protein
MIEVKGNVVSETGEKKTVNVSDKIQETLLE